MAHIKKRQNTTIRAYKFGARPLEELPQEFWDTAKQMQFVWNDLVQMRNKLTDNFGRLGLSGKEQVKQRIEYWKQFDKIWREYMKSDDIKSRLGNDEREFLQEKFEAADKRAKKEKTGLRKQFGLDRILFRHRYSGGGKPLADFKKQNSKGFSFLFPTANHYKSNRMINRRKRIGAGVFGVVKDRQAVFSFPFSAVIHRELPENAIIKSVVWSGKRLKNSGHTKKHLPESQRDWCWSIVVSAEIPQAGIHTSHGRIVALDVGWRKLNDNFLRLGALLDSDGNKIEIRCPTAYQSNNVRHGKLVSGINELFLLDEKIGNLIQSTKDNLAKLGVKNLVKMQQEGLFRLGKQLFESGENPKALEILESFKAEYLPLSSKRVRSFTRMNNYRDWIYQNIAAWLAENYDAIIWEGTLNLKKMAEDRKNLNEVETQEQKDLEKIRRMSAKYRSFASLYGFRDFIKKAFDKKGKSIIDGVTAYSSRKCSECGEIVEKFANIEFVCPNGHNFDRDFNATQNLLNQCKDNYYFVKGDEIEIPNLPNRDLSRILLKV